MKRDKNGRFIDSGNPKGKPKGAKDKKSRNIAEIVQQILDLSDINKVEKAVNSLWEDQPTTMIKFLSSIAPKDLNINADIIHSVIDISTLNKKQLEMLKELQKTLDGNT